ncbi:MAG: sensor histidine kinase [Alkalispirochaeta sp.]
MSLLLKTDADFKILSASSSDEGEQDVAPELSVGQDLLDHIDSDERGAVETAIHEGIENGVDLVRCGVVRVVAGESGHRCSVTCSPSYDPGGRFIGSAVVITAVESRDTRIAELQARVLHQETLLHEIQHRVKNDMNFVHSLLSLHAHASDNAAVKSALLDAADRVVAVSRVYSQLHVNHELKAVDGHGIVRELVDGLMNAPVASSARIHLDSDEFSVPRRAAVSLGLIINELVANAVKHAGHENQVFTIHVTVRNHEKHTVRLTVRDDGPGFPEDVRRGERLGYGFTIIRALLDDNNGDVQLWNDQGAVAEVRLNLAEQ